jgi:hypothetical protein
VLTSARAAAQTSSRGLLREGKRDLTRPAATAGPAGGLPGPVERILHDFGVTSPEMLRRASAIDRAGEQLILDAAPAAAPRHASPATSDLSMSVGTAELINHMLASGNSRAAALLGPPLPNPAREAEIEP